MEPIILRGIERLLGVVIGGIAVYLGYLLFVKLPTQTDSSGKVVLPGGINIFLSRVGPGVFFALFGAALVTVSFRQAVQVTTPKGEQVYMGADSPEQAPENGSLKPRRSEVRTAIAGLHKLLGYLPHDLPAETRIDAKLAVRASKLALIDSVWAADWGDRVAFRAWILQGEPPPVPTSFQKPTESFHHGEGASP